MLPKRLNLNIAPDKRPRNLIYISFNTTQSNIRQPAETMSYEAAANGSTLDLLMMEKSR